MFFVLKYGQILNCIKYTAMFTLSSFVSGRCNLIRLLIQGGGFRFDTEHFYKNFQRIEYATQKECICLSWKSNKHKYSLV